MSGKNKTKNRGGVEPGNLPLEASPTVVPDPPKSVASATITRAESTVTVHAARMFPDVNGQQHPDAWKHTAAAALHGWALHKHHAGKEMQLTSDEYQGAVDAVCTAPPYKPSHAALSEYRRNK